MDKPLLLHDVLVENGVNTDIPIMERQKLTEIKPGSTIHIGCKRCGKCCKHVHGNVMVTPYDLHLLTRQCSESSRTIAQKYLVPVRLSEDGFFQVYAMRGKQHEGVCAFYSAKTGCTVHENKPLLCKLYPIWQAPMPDGKTAYSWNSPLCSHADGKAYKLEEWLADNITEERAKAERAFADFCFAAGPLVVRRTKNMRPDMQDVYGKQCLESLYHGNSWDGSFLRRFEAKSKTLLHQI